VTSGLAQSSTETVNRLRLDPGRRARRRPTASAAERRTRQIDCATASTSASHCSECCAQSVSSVRLTSPSSRRSARRGRRPPRLSLLDRPSTATRTRGTPVYGDPLRLSAGLRARAPTTSAAGGDSSLELSPEGGVFSNDFLIPPALDGGFDTGAPGRPLRSTSSMCQSTRRRSVPQP